jgi:thiamine-monophosphate kinase
VGDLAHILDASRCSATLCLAALPLDPAVAALLEGPQRALALQCALAGGDDYELCFTASSPLGGRVQAAAQAAGVACTRIGAIETGTGLRVLDADGQHVALPGAFDHFATS